MRQSAMAGIGRKHRGDEGEGRCAIVDVKRCLVQWPSVFNNSKKWVAHQSQRRNMQIIETLIQMDAHPCATSKCTNAVGGGGHISVHS
jgi:hypothetical protein